VLLRRRTPTWLAFASIAVLALAAAPQLAAASAPERETAWANGQAWTLLEPRVTTDPSAELLASAAPMYVLAFPQSPSTGQFVLPPGYAPQCDPCLGVPVPAYHDHLLTGAPGAGTTGTAGLVASPRRPVLMVYSPAYVSSGHFEPVTDARTLAAAVAAGEFLPIGGPGVFDKPLPAIIFGALVPMTAG
jgi:hypothetical protein